MCNYIVFSPKYRGKVLVGDMALAAGAIIRKICEEMDIEVIDVLLILIMWPCSLNVHQSIPVTARWRIDAHAAEKST